MALIGEAILLCIRESRPSVQVMSLLRFATGVVLVDASITGRIGLGAVAWMAATFAVYVFNGAGDVEEDRLNGSVRPVARGAVSVGQALGIAGGAAALSLTLAAVAAWVLVIPVLCLLAIGYCYSAPPFRLKRNVGGQLLAGIGISFLGYGAGFLCARGLAVPAPEAMIFAIVMSLWTGMVGQTKDLPDREGDMAAGRRTLPCLLGDRKARFLLGAVALTIAASFGVLAGLLATPVLAPAVVVLAGATGVVVALHRSVSGGDRFRRRRPYRVFMVTQYSACTKVILSL